MRALTLTIKEEQAGRSVQSLLRRELQLSPAQISSLKFRETGILLNGLRCRTNRLVLAGDVLSVCIDDRPGSNPAQPMEAPLDILYEDGDLAVINKAAGMAVHGSLQGGDCTLANALAFRWGTEQIFHPVNRLDKGTSGLMVVAKNAYTHERLRRQLHTAAFRRRYMALCAPAPEKPSGRIELPIGPGEGLRRQVSASGRYACTDYETLAAGEGAALLGLELHTGRTHQIRVHLSALGCPLLGDALYGGAAVPGLSRPALHSAFAQFLHPLSGQTMAWEAKLPEDMAALTDAMMKI